MVGNLPLWCLGETPGVRTTNPKASINLYLRSQRAWVSVLPHIALMELSSPELALALWVRGPSLGLSRELAGQLLQSFPASLGGDRREGLAIYIVGLAPLH